MSHSQRETGDREEGLRWGNMMIQLGLCQVRARSVMAEPLFFSYPSPLRLSTFATRTFSRTELKRFTMSGTMACCATLTRGRTLRI